MVETLAKAQFPPGRGLALLRGQQMLVQVAYTGSAMLDEIRQRYRTTAQIDGQNGALDADIGQVAPEHSADAEQNGADIGQVTLEHSADAEQNDTDIGQVAPERGTDAEQNATDIGQVDPERGADAEQNATDIGQVAPEHSADTEDNRSDRNTAPAPVNIPANPVHESLNGGRND